MRRPTFRALPLGQSELGNSSQRSLFIWGGRSYVISGNKQQNNIAKLVVSNRKGNAAKGTV